MISMRSFWKRKSQDVASAEGAQQEGSIVVNETVVTTNARQDRFLPISILIAALVIGGSIVFATMYHPNAGVNAGGAGGTGTAGTNNPATTLSVSDIMKLGPRDAALGSSNAPVTMIEYGDYQCPFCGQFFSQAEPLIIKNYVNTGKVKLVFRNLAFLGPESTAAAEAAECAEDQNQAWPYHDALYQAKVNEVAKGGKENDGFFTRALFLSIAQQLHLDLPKFTQCVDGNTDAGIVSADVSTAEAGGINSTPTFYINGTQVLGADPYASFQQVIDKALAAK
jgi:protein-disulfide isomerase